MINDDYTELEYKYRADDVGLTEFRQYMADVMDTTAYSIDVSSWDHYYTNGKSVEFLRYRAAADSPELTIKKKINKSNSWVRREVDIELSTSPAGPDRNDMDEFMDILGFKRNFTIYKSCFIYYYKSLVYVYYIVYNEDMKELGRYIEIEVTKGGNHKDPKGLLAAAEASLEERFGIGARNRLKRSLFEIYRRHND